MTNGEHERREDYQSCVTKLKDGKFVDWKLPVALIVGWLLTIAWAMLGQYHDVRANTEFRRQITPVIQKLQTKMEVTNEILLRIEHHIERQNGG